MSSNLIEITIKVVASEMVSTRVLEAAIHRGFEDFITEYVSIVEVKSVNLTQ